MIMNKIEWFTGLNNFKNHILNGRDFTTTLNECDFEPNRNVDAIFYDHLANRKTRKVEILYSGGADSECVLQSCIRNSIPVEAMTMVIQVKKLTLNVIDLYYSEKFCRENNIKQNLFYLDAEDLYLSGKYLDYLLPYNIIEPHVASHFWLIEQCNSYPVFGGDWPWYQSNKKVLSPIKSSYSQYENFMHDKGIDGIGNMVGYSFESLYKFIELQKLCKEDSVPFLKQKIYNLSYPRIRNFGWETGYLTGFDIGKFRLDLIKKIGIEKSNIVWGTKIKSLIESNSNSNEMFF
jgi:hypothetical protein